MKTTIDIPEGVLEEAMRNAKTSTKRDAVLVAMEDYNRRCRLQSLVNRVKPTDTFMTHKQLMKLRESELREVE